jgi:tRNA A37 threonylcarbamoyladenosine synthetase subunit TsaC/SUA5/YrdC
LVEPHHAEDVSAALGAGAIVALPAVGGYVLAVQAGLPDAEARLDDLVADPDGPHFQAANSNAVRALTSGWNDEVERLLDRCWPGPLEVFLPRAGAAGAAGAGGDEAAESGGHAGGWAMVVGTPDGRALRRLCKEHGPWRTAPLVYSDAHEVAQAFDAADVALVVDGGRCDGPTATLVDATVSPLRVLREGALPANFIEGAILMNARRRLFSRQGRSRKQDAKEAPDSQQGSDQA